MKSLHYHEAIIECPFYINATKSRSEHCILSCESLFNDYKAEFHFTNEKEIKKHINKYCICNMGKNCPYYKLLMEMKYKDE